jgi:hypothetical protein
VTLSKPCDLSSFCLLSTKFSQWVLNALTHSYPHVVAKVSGVAKKKQLFSRGTGASANIIAVKLEKAISIVFVAKTYVLKSCPDTYKKTSLYCFKPCVTVLMAS